MANRREGGMKRSLFALALTLTVVITAASVWIRIA
jgi:hypothetical protein